MYNREDTLIPCQTMTNYFPNSQLQFTFSHLAARHTKINTFNDIVVTRRKSTDHLTKMDWQSVEMWSTSLVVSGSDLFTSYRVSVWITSEWWEFCVNCYRTMYSLGMSLWLLWTLIHLPDFSQSSIIWHILAETFVIDQFNRFLTSESKTWK